ncbi:MAG: acylphosphatase [Oscillospiraceae bacterium]
MVRKRIIFYGCVQRVGFRYHSRYIAGILGLTGWVRNEYDGTVTMEVQGDEQLIDRMIQTLNSDMYIDIQDMDIKNLPVNEEERSFGVSG